MEAKALNVAAKVRLWQPPAIGADICDNGTYWDVPLPEDNEGNSIEMYCTAHSQLRDGKIVFIGGGLGVTALTLHDHTMIYDPDYNPDPDPGDPPSPDAWALQDDMPEILPEEVDGNRWYATTTTLGDGTVLVTAGDLYNANPHISDIPLIFDESILPGNDLQYTELTDGEQHLPFYPHMYQLSNRKVFYAGFDKHQDDDWTIPYPETQLFNLDSESWSNKGPQPMGGPPVMYRPDLTLQRKVTS